MHSRTEPIKDGIRFSYIFEEGKDVSEIDSIVDYRTTRTIKFDVDYILKNNQLQATDSIILKSINLPLW